jgi:hypothetical protein
MKQLIFYILYVFVFILDQLIKKIQEFISIIDKLCIHIDSQFPNLILIEFSKYFRICISVVGNISYNPLLLIKFILKIKIKFYEISNIQEFSSFYKA